MNSTKWMMSLCLVSSAGCQPGLDSLEAGDEFGDSASGESADETETENGGEGSLECLAGTDLAGEPGLAFVPPCTVECAEPLGIPQLAIEWTRELDLEVSESDRLVSLDQDTLVVGRSASPESGEPHASLVLLSAATGEPLESVELIGIDQVHDLERGPEGELAMTWTSGGADWAGVVSLAGEIEWSHSLGGLVDLPSQVRWTEDGLAALHPQDELVRFDAQGSELGRFDVEGWAFDPSASGFVVMGYSLAWYDQAGNELGSESAGLDFLVDVRARGSQGALAIGIWFPEQSLVPTDALLAGYEVDLADPSWRMIHRRSDAWCAQESEEPRTAEGYAALALLDDERVILAGYESVGYPLYEDPGFDGEPVDRPEQPIVDLVGLGEGSANVLARDRGLWLGSVVDVAVDGPFAYALTTYEQTTSTTLVVRKYATP
ncbi:hypothetical protein ACNOYE_25950 [Nannocystaceae bacterium ST9]